MVAPVDIAMMLLVSRGTHCVGMVHESPVIVFPGTQTWKDVVLHDLNVKPRVWPPGGEARVHGGFANRVRYAMKDEQLHEFVAEHDAFVLGGHSLGGACAILFASYLHSKGKRVKGVYTFGVPQLGTTKFQAFYREQGLWDRTCNFFTSNDPVVTRIPYFYQKVGVYRELELEKKPSSWEEHDIASYIEGLDVL